MAIVVVPAFGADPVTITGPTLDAKVDGLATEFNGNIDNDNIASDAAIANSKLNLASISQNISHSGTMNHTGAVTLGAVTTMSSKILKEAKGADVASAAGTITLGDDGNYFDITGTAAITGITAKTAGTEVTLQFDSTASLVDGGNLKIAGNFTGAAEAQITLRCDGTNWYEVSRNNPSVSYTPTAANALSGSVVQMQYTQNSTKSSSTPAKVIPIDNTAPQSDEGFEIMTRTFTANSTSNPIRIDVCVNAGFASNGQQLTAALFLDSGASAIAAAMGTPVNANEDTTNIKFSFLTTAADTNSHTYKVRLGCDQSGVITFNGANDTVVYGVMASSIIITEYKA